MRESWLAALRRIGRAIDTPFALPATDGAADEGTWFEIRPEGIAAVGVANPVRYTDQAQAEEAARKLRSRHPDFRFVEIITYEVHNGNRSPVTSLGRFT